MSKEPEKLSLKWNDFQENVISSFGLLREEYEFADVTLACEDGRQVNAHKVILASSSPFFMNLLRKNNHPHPLIYMRGMKSEDLEAMVDFLYYGETKVYQENLDSFLAVSEELQLKGLIGSGAEKEAKDILNHFSLDKDEREIEETYEHSAQLTSTFPKDVNPNESFTPDIFTYNDEHDTSSPLEDNIVAANNTLAPDLQDLDDQINSMIKVNGKVKTCTVCGKTARSSSEIRGHIEVHHTSVAVVLRDLDVQIKSMMEGKGKNISCTVCGKTAPQINQIRDHIEVHHITGVSHTCYICRTTTRTRDAMRKHNKKHKYIKN